MEEDDDDDDDYLINGTILKKKRIELLKIKCASIFSKSFVWNVSYSKRNSAS